MRRWTVAVVLCLSFGSFWLLQWYLASHQKTLDRVADHGSQRTNEWGTKAIRELLAQGGLATNTWGAPWTRLAGKAGGQLWVINPQATPSEDETRALLEWVAAGGHVLLAVDPRSTFRGVLSGG